MKSKGLKHLSRFSGWAAQEGSVKAEQPNAMEEFFVRTQRIPKDYYQQLMILFYEWYLFDRVLTGYGMTPLQLFIRNSWKKMKNKEREIFQNYSDSNRFGLFRIKEYSSGEWIDVVEVPKGKTYRVVDEAGSKQADYDVYLFGRIFPFENHWVFNSNPIAYGPNTKHIFEGSLSDFSNNISPGSLKPRDLLTLFMPKINWEEEGLDRVRARLASFLQRWKIKDYSIKRMETEMKVFHASSELGLPPFFEDILGLAPSDHDRQQMMDVLQAFWNLSIPTMNPKIAKNTLRKGPMEKTLIQRSITFIHKKLPPETFQENPEQYEQEARRLFQEWVRVPQKELNGKTPFDVILAERKSMENPQEEIDYSISFNAIDNSKAREAAQTADEAERLLSEGKPREAVHFFEKAYSYLKSSPNVFRLLGNWAGAYIRMGNREKALELLKAALKVNPDYKIARNNLVLLESLSESNFQQKFKEGFFENVEKIVNQ